MAGCEDGRARFGGAITTDGDTVNVQVVKVVAPPEATIGTLGWAHQRYGRAFDRDRAAEETLVADEQMVAALRELGIQPDQACRMAMVAIDPGATALVTAAIRAGEGMDGWPGLGGDGGGRGGAGGRGGRGRAGGLEGGGGRGGARASALAGRGERGRGRGPPRNPHKRGACGARRARLRRRDGRR
jgi:hypothetical protein